jgi:hypothetical protein
LLLNQYRGEERPICFKYKKIGVIPRKSDKRPKACDSSLQPCKKPRVYAQRKKKSHVDLNYKQIIQFISILKERNMILIIGGVVAYLINFLF